MALTVTPDMVDISLCEDTTNWSTGDTNDAFKLEGANCLGLKVSQAESLLIAYTFPSAVDMSNGEHIYFWVQIQGLPDTKANGGIRLYVEDSSGNYGYFNVAGSDNYPGGWVCYCYAPGATYTTGSGTVNTASIKKVGVRFKVLSKALGNNPNCFWDAVRYGKGLKCISGASDGIDFQDIVDAENNDKYWGVIRKVNGVYYIKGKIYFGDTSSGDIDFKDTGQIVVFEDLEFGLAGFHEMIVQGNLSGTSNFQFGDKSGGRGISGCYLKSVGALAFKFTATDTNIDKLLLYGSIFYNADMVQLLPDAINREVVSCNFEACGEIVVDTCVVQYCNFVNADDNGIQISSASFNVTDCNFINCPNGVEITVADTYAFDALNFNNDTIDIDNTSGGSVIINVDMTTTTNPPVTSTGSTTINNSVYLRVYVKDENNNAVETAQVAIYKSSDDTQLMNEDSDVNGLAEESYNYDADTDIYVRVRKSSTGSTRYMAFSTTGIITSTGFTLTVVLIKDTVVLP